MSQLAEAAKSIIFAIALIWLLQFLNILTTGESFGLTATCLLLIFAFVCVAVNITYKITTLKKRNRNRFIFK